MCTLWVVPPPGRSAWFAKIDWYLNWQMTRGLAHELQRPSSDLLRLAHEYNLPELPLPTPTPLMVSARGRLDAEQCVVLEVSDSIRSWLQQVRELIINLGKPKTRVYLPSGVSRATAQEAWKDISTEGHFKINKLEIEFLADEEAASWSTQSQKS